MLFMLTYKKRVSWFFDLNIFLSGWFSHLTMHECNWWFLSAGANSFEQWFEPDGASFYMRHVQNWISSIEYWISVWVKGTFGICYLSFIILSFDISYSILLAFVISLSDYFSKNLKKKLNHTLSRKGDSKCIWFRWIHEILEAFESVLWLEGVYGAENGCFDVYWT